MPVKFQAIVLGDCIFVPEADGAGTAEGRTGDGGERALTTPDRESRRDVPPGSRGAPAIFGGSYVSVLQEVSPRREDLERALYFRPHTLSGTSASYGFPAVFGSGGEAWRIFFQYALQAPLGRRSAWAVDGISFGRDLVARNQLAGDQRRRARECRGCGGVQGTLPLCLPAGAASR